MKKLIVSAAIICAATAQAALFDWNGTQRIFGVTPDSVTDNGSYAMGSGSANRLDNMTMTYTLALYDAVTDAAIGTAATGNVSDDRGKVSITGMNVAAAEQGTQYRYVLTLTGTQNSLSSKAATESGGYKYDYSGAIITTTLEGSITTAIAGTTDFPDVVPSSWTVSGITKTATGGGGGTTDAPEPTSGLLLLVGAGMLALRRKQK